MVLAAGAFAARLASALNAGKAAKLAAVSVPNERPLKELPLNEPCLCPGCDWFAGCVNDVDVNEALEGAVEMVGCGGAAALGGLEGGSAKGELAGEEMPKC